MIRLLRFEHTLRWIADEEDDAQGPGAWYIDLTARSARHKTSRFYGYAVCTSPPYPNSRTLQVTHTPHIA